MSVKNGAEVASIVEFASIDLVSEGIDFLQQLIGRDDLLLQHHVTALTVDWNDLEVLNVLRDTVKQLGDFGLNLRHLVEFLHDSGLEPLGLGLHVKCLEPPALDGVELDSGLLGLFVDFIEQRLHLVVE